jgi:hypothetical protein
VGSGNHIKQYLSHVVLDLTKLHPLSSNLYLVVFATYKDEAAVSVVAD